MQQLYREVFEAWQVGGERRATTQEEYEKILCAFALFQTHKPLHLCTRKDVLAFRAHLLLAGQHPTTANRKVGVLKTLFRAGLEYELLDQNPAANIRRLTPPEAKPRIAFSSEDLRRIFDSPLYTAAFLPRGAGREAAYWLPLLALFSGARLEELCQLRVQDIRCAEGLGHYLNITDEPGHSQLKNIASRRRIPIPRLLVECGLIQHIESLPAQQRLFPALKPNPRGKLGGYFSDFFSRYLRKTVGIQDRRKVFHSFRHTFKETCRQLGIEEAVHDALTGHTHSGAGRKYGNEYYPLEPLFAAMNTFHVPGLDLQHLRRSAVAHEQKPGFCGTDFSPGSQRPSEHFISAYYGITICLGGSDGAPSVQAYHEGRQARIRIADNGILHDELPFNKRILVQAWVEIHRPELLAAWEASRNGCVCLTVAPLH